VDKEDVKTASMIEKQDANRLIINFSMDPSELELDTMKMDAWGIDQNKFIGVEITFFTKPGQEHKLPKVEAFQFGDIEENITDIFKLRKKFLLYIAISHQVRDEFLKEHFPLEKVIEGKKKFFQPLHDFVKDTILDCYKYCLICHDKIKYPGLKPPICKKKGCMSSHEKFGLGLDLELEIKENALVLDLLLCFAYAAAVENVNFQSFDSFEPVSYSLKKVS
jgi:hypothetical protein